MVCIALLGAAYRAQPLCAMPALGPGAAVVLLCHLKFGEEFPAVLLCSFWDSAPKLLFLIKYRTDETYTYIDMFLLAAVLQQNRPKYRLITKTSK